MYLCSNTKPRKGAVAPLTAILSIVLLGMVAFAVDVAWIVLTDNHLQNAADASALAGADPLMDGHVQYHLALDDVQRANVVKAVLPSSKNLAKKFAKYNYGGDVQNLELRDEDVEYGVTDGSGNYTKLGTYTSLITNGDVAPILTNGFPNTIKVFLRRDKLANGSLGMFFARAIGTENVDVRATASASVYGGKVVSYSAPPGKTVGVFPMAYDVNAWNHFVATGENLDGKTIFGANGLPEIQVYPSVKDKGNFGQLSLDGTHTGNNDIVNWIYNGMSAADIASLKNLNLIPVADNSWNWIGNPGLKAKSISEVNARTGQVFALPLFKPHNTGQPTTDDNGNVMENSYEAGVGAGSNYHYNIVDFVGIRITSDYNDNRKIIVQPAAYVEPFAIFEELEPAGPSGSLITTFTTPKLTR